MLLSWTILIKIAIALKKLNTLTLLSKICTNLSHYVFIYCCQAVSMNGRLTKPKSVGFYHVMEAFSTATNYPSRVETYRPASPQRASTPPKRTSEGHTSPRNVSFGRNINRDEEKEKRQKYLTARYGQHQMMLIRKRLAVEDWLYDKLREMYNCVVS